MKQPMTLPNSQMVPKDDGPCYSLRVLLERLGDSFSSFLYPPLCLHCREVTGSPRDLLCSHCLSLLDLLNPTERCRTCFSTESSYCSLCAKQSLHLDQVGAPFDYEGPAASLIKSFKYGGRVYLASGIAAYMAAQYVRLDWPLPNRIVPVPIAFNHWLQRGFDQTAILAEQLSILLGCPVDHRLYRKSGDYSQAGLSSAQRAQLEGGSIGLKKGSMMKGETVLLLDDVMTTGSTLRRCAEVLLEAQPRKLFGIVVCRA